jgi:predicted ATPase
MAGLLGGRERALAIQAERLTERGFLRLRRPDRSSDRPWDRYEFGHELMRRTAYEALSEPRRRLLHRQVAEALLAQQATAGSVAMHYAASDRPWLALEQALAAAERATRVAAYDEALAWCQQAMEIADAYPHAVPSGYRTRLHLQWRTLW